MSTLYSILLAVDVLLAIGLIALILLQHGKGADAGAAFGSGASATVFGARGSTSFLSRMTAVLATAFFVNSLMLAYLASHQSGMQSVVDRAPPASEGASPTPAEPVGPSDVPGGEQTGDERPDDLPADTGDVPLPAEGSGETSRPATPAGGPDVPDDVPR